MTNLPEILTAFDKPSADETNHLYRELFRHTLKKILPKDLLQETPEEKRRRFAGMLPLFTWTKPTEVPGLMSFFALFKYRRNAFKFFFEMVSCWLIPGKRLNVEISHAVDAYIPELGPDKYTLCEVMITLDNQAEYDTILRNLPIVGTEIRLGVESAYCATRILEVKGLAADQKTASIQERIASFIKRFPDHFDYDLLTEMQHMLVTCRDDFKAARECFYLSQLIGVVYLFRKALGSAVKMSPEQRHLSIKLFRGRVREQKVLGILVGVSFLRDKEVFEERHLLQAIQRYIPSAQLVEGSSWKHKSEALGMLYLEVAKESGVTGAEIELLRRELPNDLKERIEHLMHPIFMPRNEEEIMRNILSLSNQIKYLRDIPQVFISFDEQTHSHLFFNVIVVRIAKETSIQELFMKKDTSLEYIHDRCKTVGYLRKKYPKEATVFRAKLSKEPFLRIDHSIDLYKARKTVVSELHRLMGEIRDFNGGMISRQHELLDNVRLLLEEQPERPSDLLLENFFYSLTPGIMRTVLDPAILKNLLNMVHNVIEEGLGEGEIFTTKVQNEQDCVSAVLLTRDPALQESLKTAFNKLNLDSLELALGSVNLYGTYCLGWLCRTDDPYKQEHFRVTLMQAIE